MNGFSDLVVTFGTRGAPNATRLGNHWELSVDGPGGVWVSGGPGVDRLTAQEGPWTTWAVGALTSYRGATQRPLGRFTDDLARGRGNPADLDGQALVVGWDASTRQLHVWVDRLGTVHAYAGGRPGSRRLGTSFAAVAEASPCEPDWVGLTGFCGFGFYPADRTRYEDIRILRPATHTVFDDRGKVVASGRYWDWSYEPQPSRSDAAFVDEFHDVWLSSIAAGTEGRRVVVPVSGGLDSRTVLAALVPAGSSGGGVRAFTYGYSRSSVEIDVARRVAEARGLDAEEFVVEPYLFSRLGDVIGAVEGFQALTVSRQAGVSEQIERMGDVVVGGHLGDLLFDSAGYTPDLGSVAEAAWSKFAKPGNRWLLQHVCKPHLDGAPEGVLRDLLAEEVARLPDLGDPDMHLKVLKIEQWSFRWTLASVRSYLLGRPLFLPFYAGRVISHFLTAPPSQLAGRRLQVEYLRRHHPDLAAVVWQQTGTSLLRRPWDAPWALVRRGTARAVRAARRQAVIERNWEVQYLAGDGPDRLREVILGGEGAVLGDVPRAELVALLDGFLAHPDPGAGYTVDILATLAAEESEQK